MAKAAVAEQEKAPVAPTSIPPSDTKSEVKTDVAPAETPLQRIAALMILLGESASANIFKELEPEEVLNITREMIRLRTVPPKMAQSVLTRFQRAIDDREYTLLGGVDFARRALTSAFGQDKASEHLDTLAGVVREVKRDEEAEGEANMPFAGVDPGRLALLLRNEHPQTIAVLLSRMGQRQATNVLNGLAPEVRPEVIFRMATLDQISPDVVEKVLITMEKKVSSLGGSKRESFGGAKLAATLCNSLDPMTTEQILGEIEMKNVDIASNIRNLMFVFEDLVGLDSETIKTVVPRMDRKNLVIALKAASEDLRKLIFSSMSQRAGAMLRDEIDSLGPMKIRAVEAAQRELIEGLRELEREGAISLRPSAGDDYV